ncbi:uncharacterized protein LOC125649645 isoform X2 [Ostrea edulis]|uniref:uncharacterized protein LOC125649645 isoform X2 n=1 Tax=Ostrea edulis TaxID=37623 RepID=UPI0024AFE88C|nr:uncharacterized protein LOC125649645 isoform X2 [Ostrea edulis]
MHINAAADCQLEQIATVPSSFESYSTPLQSYMQQLLIYKGFTPIGSYFNKFVLREFAQEDKKLEVNTFVFVERGSKSFQGSFRWSWSCSCNIPRSSFINGLSGSVDMSYDDHSYSLHQYQPENENIKIQELSWDGEYLCVTHEDCSGIVSYKDKLHCLTCKSSKCVHTTFLSDNAKTYQIDLPYQALTSMQPKPTSSSSSWIKILSWKGIPFKFEAELMAVYSKPVLERIPSGVLVEPHTSVCKICGSMWLSDVSHIKSMPLVDNKRTTVVQVGERKCSNVMCTGVLRYDGLEHCIFHTSHTLIAYEVLFGFMDLFTRNRTTLYTYFLSLKDNHERGNDKKFQQTFSYAHFKFAWYGFLEKLCSTINFEEGFRCIQCGSAPDRLIMDATTLAHRKNLKTWTNNLQQMASDNVLHIPYSSHKDRVVISDPYTRLLLRRYAGEQPPLIEAEVTKLFDLLGYHNKELQALVQSFGRSEIAPPPYRPFLKNLALDSPICGMFHPSDHLQRIIQKMKIKDPKSSPELLEELQMQLPLVYKLVCSINHTPYHLVELLESLVEKAANSYPENTTATSLMDNHLLKDSFFPSLLPLRSRGTYKMDFTTNKKGKYECTKSKGHPSLLPGVFCLFCEHGVCYGYELMDSSESPNVPFTLILTRFKKAPSMVIYDNACRMHSYCLNRHPDFFKDTWFLVDRLHWFNHRGCNDGYNLNEYVQFNTINSQAAEQCNSSLGKLKSMLSYMTNYNFHLHCKFYLWVLNKRKQNANK